MPTRQSIDPVDMTELLANLVLVEVIDDGRDYLHKIAGEAAAKLLGADLMGHRLSEFKDDDLIAPWRNGLNIARTFKAPHIANLSHTAVSDKAIKIVFLPITRTTDGAEADFLLCAISPDPDAKQARK